MRVLVFLAALSLASSAAAQLDACVTTDYNALPVQDQTDAAAYYTLLQNAPLIAEAMDYCTDGDPAVAELPQALRDQIWAKIVYAANNPGVGTAPISAPADLEVIAPNRFVPGLPEDDYYPLGTDHRLVVMTQAELFDSWSSRIAHTLWVDLELDVPWKLASYSEEELRMLVDPGYVFLYKPAYIFNSLCVSAYVDFDTPIPNSCQADRGYPFHAIFADTYVDHSPREAADLLTPFGVYSAHSPRVALQRIHEAYLVPTNHYGGVDPKGQVTLSEYFSDDNLKTLNGVPTDQWIARAGCSRALVYAALARYANIPAYAATFRTVNSGHRGASFPTVNIHTGHGDEIAVGYENWRTPPKYSDLAFNHHLPQSCFAALNEPETDGNQRADNLGFQRAVFFTGVGAVRPEFQNKICGGIPYEDAFSLFSYLDDASCDARKDAHQATIAAEGCP